MLAKKREAKAKFEVQHKSDKIAQAQQEITEVWHKLHKTLAILVTANNEGLK